MTKHIHEAVVFEQEHLRLLNGKYRPDAPQLLHQFWLKLGLHLEVEASDVGDVLFLNNLRCVEDVS